MVVSYGSPRNQQTLQATSPASLWIPLLIASDFCPGLKPDLDGPHGFCPAWSLSDFLWITFFIRLEKEFPNTKLFKLYDIKSNQ